MTTTSSKVALKIVAVFQQQLRQQDYRDLSISDIVKRAGVGRTTFYRHFSRKLDLLLAMHQPLFDEMLSGLESAQDWHLAQPRPQLIAFLERISRISGFRRSMLYKLGNDKDSAFNQLRQRFTEQINQRLAAQFDENQFNLPLPLIATTIAAIYFDNLVLMVEQKGRYSSEEIAKVIHRLSQACLKEAMT